LTHFCKDDANSLLADPQLLPKVFAEIGHLAVFGKDVADSLSGDPQLLPNLQSAGRFLPKSAIWPFSVKQ
jgi:hypothetical protein